MVRFGRDMNEIVIYEAPGGAVEVRLDRETVWLSQAQLGDLFQRNQSAISRHIRNVFEEGELDPESNMQKMHIANSDKDELFPFWKQLPQKPRGPAPPPSFPRKRESRAEGGPAYRFMYVDQGGGLGKDYQLFSKDLTSIMENLIIDLVA
jgi:hypothetical protein